MSFVKSTRVRNKFTFTKKVLKVYSTPLSCEKRWFKQPQKIHTWCEEGRKGYLRRKKINPRKEEGKVGRREEKGG